MVDNQRLFEVKSATIRNFAQLWVSNFRSNRQLIARSAGVSALFDKFENRPALVVGAGPSLGKNIHWLAAARGKAIIIAVDTIFVSLMKNGIDPTVIITLDPQPNVAQFFYGVNTTRKVLVAPTITHPAVLDIWKGDVVFYNKFAPDIPQLIQIAQENQRLGYLIPGGSVLTVGLDLEYKMGANPLGFVGQDLSYPERGSAYAGQTVYGDQNYQLLFENRKEGMVTDTDIFGREVKTQKSMFISKQWMEWAFTTWKRKNPASFYNLTEGGIVDKHCHIASLREWVSRYCKEKRNLEWEIKKTLKRRRR